MFPRECLSIRFIWKSRKWKGLEWICEGENFLLFFWQYMLRVHVCRIWLEIEEELGNTIQATFPSILVPHYSCFEAVSSKFTLSRLWDSLILKLILIAPSNIIPTTLDAPNNYWTDIRIFVTSSHTQRKEAQGFDSEDWWVSENPRGKRGKNWKGSIVPMSTAEESRVSHCPPLHCKSWGFSEYPPPIFSMCMHLLLYSTYPYTFSGLSPETSKILLLRTKLLKRIITFLSIHPP